MAAKPGPSGGRIPSLIERAGRHGPAPALITGAAGHTYAQLVQDAAAVGTALLDGAPDLEERRVGLLAPAGREYVAAQWGTWRAGGIAVPLGTTAAPPEIAHVLADAEVRVVLVARGMRERIEPLCREREVRVRSIEEALETPPRALPEVQPERRAMILYTSGTTSRPKGVVTTHANIEAQVATLVKAWEWTADDRIPLFLPLHHVHGIVNVLGCALWAGARVETFESFDRGRILARVGEGAYTLFMAVPTVHVRLIEALESLPPDERRRCTDGFSSLRLVVSGSAALPPSVHRRFTELTGQSILERYGMTEIGMALSHPLRGERRPGTVGVPLPDVEVRLTTDSGAVIGGENEPGEIQVRGPGVFLEYWNNPEATRDAFVEGWFKTGDVALRERGQYRILGRRSVDIIKTGGHKISALEIEEVLRGHPAVRECAVVGLADATWGEVVAVAVEPGSGAGMDLEGLQAWARERLSPEKMPRRLVCVSALPRNALGKVVKPAVRDLFG